ncbi:helix-turn-helix domain-containing protein [Paenibacillus sp. JX-17]|uniref:Helix-turn-helix domain-containing protein n=1 Tax=Paenibacillus lacisoli TaxID=3064525 RepID=A0ABT9C931_9BACL|nr:RodZ family helix-turn-helix domain-containing protein [Paenibacillus sp. JX-17]MDO7905764.1 helix-turn-helix domain-containing protein [Paenibacillus sp. JX-17]
MSELGQQLREARLEKGMSLDDVQEMTKIRKRYLEAIEAGDYKVLPGTFYVRAFIKTYAETVGLNPDELLEGHKKDVPAPEPEAVMEPVTQKRSSRPSSGGERNFRWMPTMLMWLFPLLIIVVVIYIIVSKDSGDPAPQQAAQPATEQTAPAADDSKPQTDTSTPADDSSKPADQGDSTNQQGGGAGGTTDGTDGTATGQDGTTTTPGEAGTAPEDGTPADQTDTAAGGVTVSPDGKSGSMTKFKVASAGGAPVKVEIKASGRSWLEVYKGQNSRGEKLERKTTEDGDTFSFDLGSEGLYIKSGYSPATAISVGGQPVTDGKSTSRILLSLDDSASGTDNASGDSGTSADTSADTSDSTDSNN